MIRQKLRELFRNLGFEINGYNRKYSQYKRLYKKYKDYTMIPDRYFYSNLDLVSKYSNIKGNYVECGVWRGGMSAAISEVIANDINFHLFDSFEGLPDVEEIDGEKAKAWKTNKNAPEYYDNCRAEESFLQEAMKAANKTNFKIYRGWFNDTMQLYPKESIAILRLDGDWYSSTKVCLDYLFPLVKRGGIIILDDYYAWEGCSKAVHDYLSETKSSCVVQSWRGILAYIVKDK